MIIEATEDQVIEAARKAIAASSPMGMGFLHYSKTDDNPDIEEVRMHLSRYGMDIDYFRGRMVKFHLDRLGTNKWEANDTISPDYQSWNCRYASYSALFD
jgi:hypothetical protein